MKSTRRRFLKQTFGFSAALTTWGTTKWPLSSVLGADDIKPLPGGDEVCHMVAVGDFGVVAKDLARQKAVADGMVKYAQATRIAPKAMLMLGDNFYGGLAGKGVRSPRWGVNVEDMYPAAAFPCPMYAMLGNHDYNDEKGHASVLAQLGYRTQFPDSRWTMPAAYYRFEMPAKNPVASFIVLDTNFIYGDQTMMTNAQKATQLEWFAKELAKPRTAPWLFVLGHHPVFSGGKHGDTTALVNEVDPLLRKHKVDLYLSGHDHDLQHTEFDKHPTSFVVSGAGGARAREIDKSVEGKAAQRGPFAEAIYGFSHLELTPTRFRLSHIDANGKRLHAFSKVPGGQVTVEPTV